MLLAGAAYHVQISNNKISLIQASSSLPLVEVLCLSSKFNALGDACSRPPIEDLGLELNPDGARRGHPVPPNRLEGWFESLDVPDVDLVKELRLTCVFALQQQLTCPERSQFAIEQLISVEDVPDVTDIALVEQ